MSNETSLDLHDESLPEDRIISDHPETLRDRIRKTNTDIDRQYIRLGKDLYIVYSLELYKTHYGYATFNEWVSKDIGITEDKAMSLKRIFHKYIKLAGANTESLLGIGYSRAVMMAPLVDKKNVNEWLDKAKSLKFKEFKDAVQEAKATKPRFTLTKIDGKETGHPTATENGVPVEITKSPELGIIETPRTEVEYSPEKKTYYLFPEQVEVINNAIELASKRTGSLKDGHNLTCVAQEYIVAQATKDTSFASRVQFYMRNLEQLAKGKLLLIKDPKAFEALINSIESNPELKEYFTNDSITTGD